MLVLRSEDNLKMTSEHVLISGHVHYCERGIVHILFVCFVALRPKSTAMVMAGRSVHLTTLFPGQALTSS